VVKNNLVILICLFLLLSLGVGVFVYFNRPQISKIGLSPSNGTGKIIKLAYNPWMASELNATIAKVILEKELGYKVELTKIDEFAQWMPLSTGQLHASLEVWPSGHPDEYKKYIVSDKTIEDGGLLGPIGKMGWYIPDYLARQYPRLTTWEGYKDPILTKVLATKETGNKGRFISGDPTWIQYEPDIIKNLGLNLQTVQLDSEEKVLAALDAAYTKKEPFLFYFWTPHWAMSVYDLVPVSLPPYSDVCYSKIKTHGVNCDYPSDKFYKVFWSGLKTYAPSAYNFLKKFNYTTLDQISLMAKVQIDKKTVAEAAQAWVDDHRTTWERWLAN
jgi:glycine betaine/proline transport system substrate-binding protein